MSDKSKNLNPTHDDHPNDPPVPGRPGRSRSSMLDELGDISTNEGPLVISFSDDNDMLGKHITLTKDGDDIKIAFEDNGNSDVQNRFSSSQIREIASGLELIQFYKDSSNTSHKITLIVLNPPNEKPSIFYYIVHASPTTYPFPPGNDHGHPHEHPHLSSQDEAVIDWLTHESGHGGGRGG